MDRLLNYLFIFILLLLFVIVANGYEQWRIVAAVGLSVGICTIAFLFNWLTLDGARAAIILGTYTYGIGGIKATIILLVFFVTGSWLSKLNGFKIRRKENPYHLGDRRDGLQVWANGFWFIFFLILYFIFKSPIWFITAVASIAAANADTWATEVGTLFKKAKTILITNFKPVKVGEDGGVSLYGTIAAALGSSLIGAVYMAFTRLEPNMIFLIIIISGFVGCFIDSFLGAIFQFRKKTFYIPAFSVDELTFGNNVVNWSAIGLGAITALILYNIL
ncbi:MAG TPA: DUF92 domain-containing protein [Balneolales bacterium]|nr:DUF92 domain-containing protein [Balneolales bacterium]